jgi:hypothetical protein
VPIRRKQPTTVGLDAEVQITTTVTDHDSGRTVSKFTTTGTTADHDGVHDVSHATNPALTDALAAHQLIIEALDSGQGRDHA